MAIVPAEGMSVVRRVEARSSRCHAPLSLAMLPYAVAFGLLAHTLFWGAGLAMLAMPRPWRSSWPVVAGLCGLALQSAVVWFGAYANLRGTNAYAWPAEAVPLALLAIGAARRRGRLVAEAKRFAWVWAAAAVALAALVRPLAAAAKGLTTASLGSCDAADYAGCARALQEFARGDRTGFLAISEVAHTFAAKTFFDYGLLINHFAPAALIAFSGTIFRCRPYELTGFIPMLAVAVSVPAVYWLARAGFRFPAGAALAIAAFYGFSPIAWYAVDQVAIGQLFAAPAIAVVTFAGFAVWRGGPGAGRRCFWLLAVAYALVWGSYNFMVTVAAAPAIGYALGKSFLDSRWRKLPSWIAWMAAPFAASGLVFWPRAASVVDRFRLIRHYDLGWPIPALSPEGWLGMVRGPTLRPYAELRLGLLLIAAALIVPALVNGLRRGSRLASTMLFTAALPIGGYIYLLRQGGWLGQPNYDAYKLLSVFYPCILPVLFCWLHPSCVALGLRRTAFGGLAIVAGFTLGADAGFARAMASAPLVVDRCLLEIGRLEANARAASLNLRLPTMWGRLWANALLLRKPQYFPSDTYESRWHTPLRGKWDLNGGGITVSLPGGDSVPLGPRYSAVRVASPSYLRASLGEGWYAPERLPRTAIVWRWTGNRAAIDVDNPQARPLRVRLRLDGNSLRERRLELWGNGVRLASVVVGRTRGIRVTDPMTILPGAQKLELRPDFPAGPAGPADARRLAFCVFDLDLEVLPDGPALAANRVPKSLEPGALIAATPVFSSPP